MCLPELHANPGDLGLTHAKRPELGNTQAAQQVRRQRACVVPDSRDDCRSQWSLHPLSFYGHVTSLGDGRSWEEVTSRALSATHGDF